MPRSRFSTSTARSKNSSSTNGRRLELTPAEPPEDWSGSVDVDDEELDELADKPEENFDDPLEYLDRQD